MKTCSLSSHLYVLKAIMPLRKAIGSGHARTGLVKNLCACRRENHNVHDPFAVAILKANNVSQQRAQYKYKIYASFYFTNAMQFAKFVKLKDL